MSEHLLEPQPTEIYLREVWVDGRLFQHCHSTELAVWDRWCDEVDDPPIRAACDEKVEVRLYSGSAQWHRDLAPLISRLNQRAGAKG